MELDAYTKAEPIVEEIRNLDKLIGKLKTADINMGQLSWSCIAIGTSTQDAMLSALALERGNLMDALSKI